MHITSQDKQEYSTAGVSKIKEMLKAEHSALLKRLKKATDISTLRHAQGSLEIVEGVQQLMAD